MEYKREEYDNGVRILSDGDEIYRSEGPWSEVEDELLDAILEDANFGNPQKNALKALFGMINSEEIDDELP